MPSLLNQTKLFLNIYNFPNVCNKVSYLFVKFRKFENYLNKVDDNIKYPQQILLAKILLKILKDTKNNEKKVLSKILSMIRATRMLLY